MPLLANDLNPPWYLAVAAFGALLMAALFLRGRDRASIVRLLSSPVFSRLFGLSIVVAGVVMEALILYSTVIEVLKKQRAIAVPVGVTAFTAMFVVYGLMILVVGSKSPSFVYMGQGTSVSSRQWKAVVVCLVIGAIAELAFQLWLRTHGYR